MAQIAPSPASSPSEASYAATMNASHNSKSKPADAQQATAGARDAAYQVAWWDQSMSDEFDISSGYKDIKVLIIKWSKTLDELNCEHEVKELRSTFETDLGWATRICELNNTRVSPQMELNWAIQNFIRDFDDERVLLVIYYSGHGTLLESSNDLQLSADAKGTGSMGCSWPATAIWQKAEEPLLGHDLKADVFAILDTCFAGDVQRGEPEQVPEPTRTYELLAAGGPGRVTSGPGPRSFTTALRNALVMLLKKYKDEVFTARELCERITQNVERKFNPPFLSARMKKYEHVIKLHSLKNQKKLNPPKKSLAELTVRLRLGVKGLTQGQIKDAAQKISIAAKSLTVPVYRVDWVGFQALVCSSELHTHYWVLLALVKFKSLLPKHLPTNRKRIEKVIDSCERRSRPITPLSVPPTAMKRSWEDDLLDLHQSKRRATSPLTSPATTE